MSYFDQYSGAVAGLANQYGMPVPLADAWVQQESSWNPNAAAPNSSAVGFLQILKGTGQQLGIDRYDPMQNLQGGFKYLSEMPGSTWAEKFAHYYQGPNAVLNGSGLAYANSIFQKAKAYVTGGGNGPDIGTIAQDAGQAGMCASGDPMACAQLGTSLLGGGSGDQCGMFDFVCKLQKWVSQSNFFTRLALASLALLLVLGGLYLMKERN